MITIDYIGRGVEKNPKSDYVIFEQPLTFYWRGMKPSSQEVLP